MGWFFWMGEWVEGVLLSGLSLTGLSREPLLQKLAWSLNRFLVAFQSSIWKALGMMNSSTWEHREMNEGMLCV